MAYASWSVVFGEQPSAAKWNILGTNDASFNDASGTPSVPKSVNRQDIAANSVVTDQLLQFGWTYVTGDATNLREAITVTFPVAFDVIPLVLPVSLGVRVGSNPDTLDDFTPLAATFGDVGWVVDTSAVSTTQVTITINKTGTAIGTANRLGLGWLAIGTKAR